MAISTVNEDGISEAEAPLLNGGAIAGYVDVKGRPSVRSRSGRWKSASFIIAAGVAERLAYYGVSANLVSYLTENLGQPTATAAAQLNAWYGTAALLPILGAFLADSFSGRFRMIILASLLYISALCFLSLSAATNSYKSSDCKPAANWAPCSPNQLQIIFVFCSLYLVALAQGGLTPCVQTFGADQFDEEDEDECKAKSSFFNWYNFLGSVGLLAPLLLITYIQDNVSWVLGFGIPAIVMCFALIVFLTGSMTYRFRINTDKRNPFVRISRVFLKAATNWRAAPVVISIEEDKTLPLKSAEVKMSFLDKALLSPGGLLDDCTISDVEDAKSIVRLAPVWFACLGYSIVFAQPSTLFTKQAATLDRHVTSTFQIPAASFQQLISVSIILTIPIYDRILVPVAREITKKPSGISMLQRIGTGLVLSLSAIVFAALVERKRLTLAREYGLVEIPKAIIPMSVWWLVPQYLISGIADVFTIIGLQEFFYDQVPSELKSIGLALYLSILGIGSIASSFLISSIQKATSADGRDGWFSDNLNRAHLDYFYWLLAGLSASGLVVFVYLSKSYVYRRKISL